MLDKGKVPQYLGLAGGMENGACQLPVSLMGRIQGHDLHGDERCGELRAAENMHEHGSFHSGEAGEPCRDPKEERREPGQKVPHMFAVVLAPGNGEFTHDQRGHGGYEQKTCGADALGQREIALLCAAVEPLEHPAFGGKGQRREQRLHEQRHTVVGKFACVGEALVACEAEIDMRP